MPTVWRDARTRGLSRWCILYKGLDGKWHRERTEATTKGQALKLLAIKMTRVSEAKIRGVQSLEEVTPLTFSEFIEKEYLPHQEATKRPGTYDREKELYANVKKTFGPKLLVAITANDIRKYITARRKEKTRRGTPPSPAQLNRERQFLSGALNAALMADYIDRNPLSKVKRLKEDNERDRKVSFREEDRIVSFSPPFLQPIIGFATGTGMREAEICFMRWAEVDRETGFIRVGQESKGHKPRYVPINSDVAAILDAQRPFIGPNGPSPYVFVNPQRGKPYNPDSVSHYFKAAALRAGIDDVTFHTLRHTFVSRMVEVGMPDRKIMKIVGHSSAHMVSRYAHLAPDTLSGTTEAIARRKMAKDRTRIVQKRAGQRGVL